MSQVEPWTTLTAVAAPLLRDNVDTDAIIPSREINSVSKLGLADGLFAGWRYESIGTRVPDPSFVLNMPRYAGARILVSGANFGCGSSREHAVWALREFGIRAVVAPGFAPIFESNCIRNGLAPVRLDDAAVASLARLIAAGPESVPVTIDLPRGEVSVLPDFRATFSLDAEAREMLVEGLDAIDLTLKQQSLIIEYWRRDREGRPWIYTS